MRPAPQTTLLLPLECLEVALVNLLVIYWPLQTLIYGLYRYKNPMSGWTVLFLVSFFKCFPASLTCTLTEHA